MRAFPFQAAVIALLSANMAGGGALPRSEPVQAGAPAVPIAAVAIGAPAPATRPEPPLTVAAAGVSTIRRSNDGLFYVNATVGGGNIRFLVDTGANITVLTRADAERLGLTGRVDARGTTLQTAGGPTAMQWTKIPQMKVADKPVDNIDAAIIDRGIQVSLLGQNVLSRLDGMTFSGDQLQFH